MLTWRAFSANRGPANPRARKPAMGPYKPANPRARGAALVLGNKGTNVEKKLENGLE